MPQKRITRVAPCCTVAMHTSAAPSFVWRSTEAGFSTIVTALQICCRSLTRSNAESGTSGCTAGIPCHGSSSMRSSEMGFQLPKRAALGQTLASFVAFSFFATGRRRRHLWSLSRLDLLLLEDHNATGHGSVLGAPVLDGFQLCPCGSHVLHRFFCHKLNETMNTSHVRWLNFIPHQGQPSARSATPATRNKRGCHEAPRLPSKTKVDVAKCHAYHAKCGGVTGDYIIQSKRPTEPALRPKCHACHARPRWISRSATPAWQNKGGCRQVPHLPCKVWRHHRRLIQSKRATKASPVP